MNPHAKHVACHTPHSTKHAASGIVQALYRHCTGIVQHCTATPRKNPVQPGSTLQQVFCCCFSNTCTHYITAHHITKQRMAGPAEGVAVAPVEPRAAAPDADSPAAGEAPARHSDRKKDLRPLPGVC
jgi:hypothetical protein